MTGRQGNKVNLIATLAITFLIAPVASGQRLDISDAAPTWKPLQISGTVREVNKYSFVLETDDGDLRKIELEPRTRFQLVMERPVFQLDSWRVQVDYGATGRETTNARREFPLPEPAWLVVEFQHDRQRDRILKMNPVRINNYRITPEPPSEIDPLRPFGRLAAKDNRLVWELESGSSYVVRPGFQNAILEGLSILHLEPDVSRVELDGRTDGSRILAARIRFWPNSQDE